MQYLPGNMELSGEVFERSVWNNLKEILNAEEGILGYKIPALGNKYIEDIPSLILRSAKYGVVLIDVISERIIDFIENSNFWLTENGHDIRSRDLLISIYQRDLENKVSKSQSFFDYKTNETKRLSENK